MIHTRDQYLILFSARSSKKDDLIILDLIILKGFCFNFFGISYLFIHFSPSFFLFLLFALANNNRLSGIPMNFDAISWSIYYTHFVVVGVLFSLLNSILTMPLFSPSLSLTHSRILHLLSAVLLISFKSFIFLFFYNILYKFSINLHFVRSNVK